MKEHAGGTPTYALEDWSEESFAVPIAHAPVLVDSLRDIIRDRIAAGEDDVAIIVSVGQQIGATIALDAIRRLLAVIASSPKPGLTVHQLLWAAGFTAMLQGENIPSLARKHGISKQDFQQGAERLRRKLGLPMTQSMRDEESRQLMGKRNYRNKKGVLERF